VLPHNIEIVMWPQITVTSLHPTYWLLCRMIRSCHGREEVLLTDG